MSESDIVYLIGYLLGSFCVGYAAGFLTTTLKKGFDQV